MCLQGPGAGTAPKYSGIGAWCRSLLTVDDQVAAQASNDVRAPDSGRRGQVVVPVACPIRALSSGLDGCQGASSARSTIPESRARACLQSGGAGSIPVTRTAFAGCSAFIYLECAAAGWFLPVGYAATNTVASRLSRGHR